MAYGLDFQEIYYADHNRFDLGVLETYEIDIDLANEKDFRIISPDPVIPVGGFWYIQDTEYGGIVDAFETDSDEEKVEYRGRTFRGLLDSHILDVDGEQRTIPERTVAVLDEEGGLLDDSEMIMSTISDCFTELIEECGLDGVFKVDEPYIDESVSALVSSYTFERGTTLYDVMMGLARGSDFSFMLQYKSDHFIHIAPLLIQDYTDYLRGSKYDALGFQTEINSAVTNHIICSIENEGEPVRTIHVFTDENGGVQPYATVDNPIKDSQYILDKSNQVLTGVDEIAEHIDANGAVVENYELVAEAPSDWLTNFGSYYLFSLVYEQVIPEGTENPAEEGWYEQDGVNEGKYVLTGDTTVKTGKKYYVQTDQASYTEYEAVGEEVYTAVTSRPSDWNSNYSSYFIRNWDESAGAFRYSNYSANSIIDLNSKKKIKKKPFDWRYNYGDYRYAFQTGDRQTFPPNGIEYRQYEGVSKNKFIKLTRKPDDWNTNFGSYYRKVFKRETEVKNGKKKILVDYVKKNGEYYTTAKATDDGKNKRRPIFSKRTYYKKETYTVAPSYLKNNCYRFKLKNVPPAFMPQNCYALRMAYHAPEFVKGKTYVQVLDHYKSAVEDALKIFEEEKLKSTQTMELEDFVVNIGDIVGGTDEFTGTSVIGNITNIEAKIENGLIDVAYTVTVDDYTTQIDVKRLPEDEESEEE